MLLSIVLHGEPELAYQILEKEMNSKKMMDLVNNPNTYAILYYLA